ncbi:MAG: SDR family oxidoreductase [Phenylobacterium sp.]|uniref:SDR family oxidoreductase n=1 Tax=Phenylobacterium sp. TaxID=1871053 RepID=UPI0011FF8801|nr:SDR family oxidoreductase [Phenylobacterium sp.]TAJ71863.1 MAG: SDR family oxidoreductase [Phenylobacterium sp.]
MNLEDKIVVVTGAASGIGRALCVRFEAEGAKAIVCADRDHAGAKATAEMCGGRAFMTDVSREADIRALIETVEAEIGPIDLFCSNAGIGVGGGTETPDVDWQRIWDINVMAHVWAARHLTPLMAARGGGYLMNTSSAAGLLSQIGSAPYAVTKHAAVGLAEWLAITHGDQGIKVSVLCPQAVKTAMTAGNPDGVAAIDGMMEPEFLADVVVQSLEKEEFLILPHPEVLTYMRNKTADYDRWIGGMRKLNRRFAG